MGRGEKKINPVFQAKNHQHGKSRYEDIKSLQFTGLTYCGPMFHWGQWNLWMMLSILKILCFSPSYSPLFLWCKTSHPFVSYFCPIFLVKLYQSTYGYSCPWVLFYQKHNSEKLGLEDSPTSEERRCQEGHLKESWSRSASVNRIKNFLLHARKYPTILIY